MTEFFKNTKIKDLILDEISNNLQKAIIEDPELADTTNIAVKAKTESGSQEIIENNTSNSIKVANELATE